MSKGSFEEPEPVRGLCPLLLSVTVSLSGSIATRLNLGDGNKRPKTFEPVDEPECVFGLEINRWRSKSVPDESRAIAGDKGRVARARRGLRRRIVRMCPLPLPLLRAASYAVCVVIQAVTANGAAPCGQRWYQGWRWCDASLRSTKSHSTSSLSGLFRHECSWRQRQL